MKIAYSLIVILALVVVAGLLYTYRPGARLAVPEPVLPSPTPVDDTIKLGEKEEPPAEPIAQTVNVTLKTSLGDIELALIGQAAPLTVGNFVKLAQEDFYDGTAFHRVIPSFMIQGGDPTSRNQEARAQHGTGGPGYTFQDEINAVRYGLDKMPLAQALPPQQLAQLPPEAKEWSVQQLYEAQGYRYSANLPSLPLERGVLAMANSGPNTNGSQFFIITASQVSRLNGRHTAFGRVTGGMEVVDAIAAVERDENDNPVEPVVIEDVIVGDVPVNPLSIHSPAPGN